MNAIFTTDFRSKECTFPLLRAALVCANMSSPKSQDGVSKLLFQSDLLKLKAPAMKEETEACQKLLGLTFQQTMGTDASLSDKVAVKVLAKMFIRTALLVTQKSGKGKGKRSLDSLDEICKAFAAELQGPQAGTAQSSAGAEGANPSLAWDDKVLSLQEARGASCIAAQHFPWLQPELNYLRKQDGVVYTFKQMGPDSGTFSYVTSKSRSQHSP